MTAKIYTKFASKQVGFSNDQWVTLVQSRASSPSSSGSLIKGPGTTQTISPKSQRNGGATYVPEPQQRQRSRSTKPSARLKKLRSKIYRASFAEAATSTQIATQIRLLRETAGLSQSDLAKKLGTRQSAVARLEDANYGRQSLAILHRIARAFDVVAWVEFIPYSTLLRRTVDLSPSALTPRSYNDEFDGNGEPTAAVDLNFDGSAICKSHYVTTGSGSRWIQTTSGSRTTVLSQWTNGYSDD